MNEHMDLPTLVFLTHFDLLLLANELLENLKTARESGLDETFQALSRSKETLDHWKDELPGRLRRDESDEAAHFEPFVLLKYAQNTFPAHIRYLCLHIYAVTSIMPSGCYLFGELKMPLPKL